MTASGNLCTLLDNIEFPMDNLQTTNKNKILRLSSNHFHPIKLCVHWQAQHVMEIIHTDVEYMSDMEH